MTKLLYFLTTFAFLKHLAVCNGDELENFILNKLNEYPMWLKENNLDPSPLLTGPTDMSAENSYLKLDCYLLNHGVSEYSKDPEVTEISSGGLINGYIVLEYTFSPGTVFQGDYVANGSLYSKIPFSGQGRWNITANRIRTAINIRFDITPIGYVNITHYTPTSNSFFPFENVLIYFEKLWDDEDVAGYAQYIKVAIFDKFETYLLKSMDHPFNAPLETFLKKTFNETSLADIIGTTPSPTTTTPHSVLSKKRIE